MAAPAAFVNVVVLLPGVYVPLMVKFPPTLKLIPCASSVLLAETIRVPFNVNGDTYNLIVGVLAANPEIVRLFNAVRDWMPMLPVGVFALPIVIVDPVVIVELAGSNRSEGTVAL